MWMGVGCPSPRVHNDIVTPRHLFSFKIYLKVEKLWKEEGTEGPTDAHWEKARDPFRRFIGFGKEGYSNKAAVKPCFEDLRVIFRYQRFCLSLITHLSSSVECLQPLFTLSSLSQCYLNLNSSSVLMLL